MLQQALEHLMEAKSFEKISVAEIAEDATLNRATFYDHYPDKFALLEGLVSARFQELLTKRGIVFEGCASALKGVTLAMCDYLEHQQFEKHSEAALMAVVRGMVLCGLKRHPAETGVAPELIAATVSGAIYGGVNEWVRTVNRCAAEEVVESIFKLVGPMLQAS